MMANPTCVTRAVSLGDTVFQSSQREKALNGPLFVEETVA